MTEQLPTKEMVIKPLFIPLLSEYFYAFKRGEKDTEYRVYGPGWNERTCFPGRPVVLSKGYGRHERLNGIVESFRVERDENRPASFLKVYGRADYLRAACIKVKLVADQVPSAKKQVSEETLRAWIRDSESLIESGVATDSAAVCPIALARLCRDVLASREATEPCAKLVADTGGGCSVCGATPCVNVLGTYWLCGHCVLEHLHLRLPLPREPE